MSKCTRCGKERIVASTYKEKVGNSTITYTINVCPDSECQKIVDDILKTEELKRIAMHEESQRRALQRTAAKASAS